MIAHTYRILIGANGWRHPAWQEQFYPDDLPDDWQLGYYSNEFPLVFMPASYWQDVRQELPGWLEDSSDDLRMVCEVPVELMAAPTDKAVQGMNDFISSLSVVGAHCVGLLLPVTDPNVAIAQIITQLNSPLPYCIDVCTDLSATDCKAIQKVCEENVLGLCWHGQGSAAGLGLGPLAITKINSQGMTMRQLRDVVETILNTTRPEQTCVLIFDGAPPDLEAIRHAGVILDLF